MGQIGGKYGIVMGNRVYGWKRGMLKIGKNGRIIVWMVG